MARDDDLDLERARRRHRHPSEAMELSTMPPTLTGGTGAPHPSENLEFATVAPALGRVETRPHPSEMLEFATVSPSLSPTTTRHSIPPPSRSLSSTQPHPSEELEFATIPPTLNRLDTKPQSFRSRDFASMSPSRSPMDTRHLAPTPSPSSSSNTRPHPSENVEFSTVPTNISGLEHGPHPSEELEFTTVPTAISGLGQIRSNTTETIDFANVFSSSRSQRSPSDTADLSSITSKPRVTHVEYAYDGSPSPPNNLERRNTLESVEIGVKQRMNSVNELMMRLAQGIPGLNLQDAKKAAQKEQKMTLRQGLKLYPKAIGWSLMLSFTLVMEGYDLSIVNGFFAFPVFKRRFGELTPSGYEVSTAWQSALGNGAVVGEILGLFSNGIITEKVGYRMCLIYALIWLCCAIFLAFFSQGIGMLMASEVLCGLSWGVFQTLSTTYAAEVMPVALRAYLTSNVNLCWLVGQVIGLGILRGTVGWRDEWSYRLPFGLQWMWAIPILVGTSLAPESPWWLVRRERYQDAKNSLKRLTSKESDSNIDETIAMMRHTNEVEKYLTAGTSYWDCLKGVDLRRTEIVCMVWIIQTISGSPMTGFSAYFFTRAGFNATKAFDLSTGMYGLAIIAHMVALILMRYVGRRKMYMWGCASMSLTLFIAGGVGCMKESASTQWALGALIIIMTFFYDLTIGPVCYSLVAEIPSTRLRIKTVVLGRVAYNVAGIISNVLMPQMLNPEAWNLKGKTCFLWAVTALLSMVWCYYRLPEPKGLTYIELDILFQKKASAKKFRAFQVNLADRGYFELQEKKDEDKHWEGVR